MLSIKTLRRLPKGQVRFSEDTRLQLVHGTFADLSEIVAQMGKTGELSGVLLDLGVSSPQIDQAERGFSFYARWSAGYAHG